jgi:hypothetical protein
LERKVLIAVRSLRSPIIWQNNIITPKLSVAGLHARVRRDVTTICEALGYDLNTVEFAIKDGVPYAIDFMNPAPDA